MPLSGTTNPPKPLGTKSRISTIPTLPRIVEYAEQVGVTASTVGTTSGGPGGAGHMGFGGPSDRAVVMVVVPPDGGFAWCIVAASFLCNFLIDGIVLSFGLFMEPMAATMGCTATQVTLIGSLQMGMYYLSGPFTCAAVNRWGFRWVAVVGAIVAAVGMLAASLLDQFTSVLLLYGVLAGLGGGIVYSPAVIIVGYYFERYRAIATGIAMCGSAAGVVCLSPIFAACIKRFGWQRTVQLQAGLMACCVLLCLLFRQIPSTPIVVGDGGVGDEDEDDGVGGNASGQLPLDECADAISETSSQIEFSYIFSMVPHLRTQAAATASGQMGVGTPAAEQFSIVSRRTGAVSMKTFRSRFVALYQEPPATQTSVPPTTCCYYYSLFLQKYATKVPFWNKICSCCNRPPVDRPIVDEKLPKATQDNSANCWYTGPMNRQDIFYSGSLIRIPEYRNEHRSTAATAATTLKIPVDAVSNDGDANRTCCALPRALTNVLRLLVDVSLLRSASFGVLLVMNFLFVLGLLTPYMFLTNRANSNGFDPEKTMWLISILSLGNMIGRIVAGLASFLPRLDVVNLVASSTIVAGLISVVNAFYFVRDWSMQIVYAIMLGLALAFCPPMRTIIYVKYLGLERLTNAFGLSMLIIGVAAMAGSPLAGFVHTATGDYKYAFLLSGLCHIVSGAVLLLLKPIHQWEKRCHRNR